MLRSMFSAISGMRAHQTKLDVTGNNIANVNTVGFKASQTVFEDTLSQVVRNGGAPGGDIGGTNPAQIGLGVKVGAITTNFAQGASQATNRDEDFMINGDGFFVTRMGTEQLFTRSGSMAFDSEGQLVTPDGAKLQGWPAVNGAVNANGAIGDLTIPFGQIVAPRATANAVFAGNLPADATVATAPIIQPVKMFDALGTAHTYTYEFRKLAAAGAWEMRVTDDAAPPVTTTVPLQFATTAPVPPATTPAAGSLTTPAAPGTTTVPGPGGPVTVDLAGLVQYGSKASVALDSQDGYTSGTLASFSLGDDGTLMGVFTNDQRVPLGRVALANFDNPNGLSKAGNSAYRVGNNSGLAQIGQAGTGSRGTLASGMLEMSNVDLAEEFTGLIVAQRGFQANSRVITASDEILQDLVRLGR